MLTDHSGLSRFERLLTLFTRVRPGEGRSALLFMLHAFLLLFSYQVVKALREAFMLAKFSAETRSYAVAVTALVLMLLVPVYGAVRRRIDGARLLQAVTIFFAANMLMFAAAAWSGASIAFAFFVWASIYGVMVVAQLWAFAADSFNLKSGQRLFPVIMVGANIGALVGAKTAQLAVQALTPVGLMVVAALLLFVTVLLATPERAAVPDGSRAIAAEHGKPVPKLLGGIGLVLRDRYLLLVALLVVLLNWVNTTGEFILADFVQRDACGALTRERRRARPGHADRRVLRQFPVLGHGRRPRDPAVPGGAHLSHGRSARRAAGAAGSGGDRVRAAGAVAAARRLRAHLHADPAREDRRERDRLLAHEHHAPGAVPAGGPRLQVRRQDRDRHVLLAHRRPDPGRRGLRRAQRARLGRARRSRCSTSCWRSRGSRSRSPSAASSDARQARTSSTWRRKRTGRSRTSPTCRAGWSSTWWRRTRSSTRIRATCSASRRGSHDGRQLPALAHVRCEDAPVHRAAAGRLLRGAQGDRRRERRRRPRGDEHVRDALARSSAGG